MLLLPLALLAAPATSPFLKVETGAHIGQVFAAAPYRGGFATLGVDKAVRLWDAEGRPGRVLRYPSGVGTGAPASLSVSGDRISVGTSAADQATAFVLDGEGDAPSTIRVAPRFAVSTLIDGGNTVATLGQDMVLRVLAAGDAPEISHKFEETADAVRLGASPDGKRIVVALHMGQNTDLHVLGRKDLKTVGDRLVIPTQVRGIGVDSRGTWIAGDHYAAYCPFGGEPQKLDGLGDSSWTAVAPMPAGGALFVGGDKDLRGVAARVAATGSTIWTRDLGLAYATAVAVGEGGRALVGTSVGDLFRVDLDGGSRLVGASSLTPVRVGWSVDGSSVVWSDELDRSKSVEPRWNGAFDLANGSLVPPSEPAPGDRLPTSPGVIPFKSGESISIPGRATADVRAAVALPDGRTAVSLEEGLFAVQTDKKTLRLDCDGTGVRGLALSPDRRYLAAACDDGIIRIFAVKDLNVRGARPMLLLYARAGGEWIEWTDRECLYNSSPSGDRLLNLQRTLADGRVLFEPVDTREARYRRPDVLKKAFQAGSVAEATGGETAPAPLATTESCVIRLKTVRGFVEKLDENHYRFAKPEATLVFSVPQGIRSIRRTVNVGAKDAEVGGLESPDSDTRTWTATGLTPGANILTFVGVRDDGTTSDPVRVQIDVPGEPLGTTRVLVLGVSDYETVGPLPSNRGDAKRIAEYFRAQNGTAVGKVVVTEVEGAQTDRAGILRAFEAFKATIQPADTAILYVSSHGAVVKKQFVMLPKDFDSGNPDKAGIPWTQVIDAITSRPCKNALLIQDACHAGGVTAEMESLATARDSDTRLSRQNKLFVFSSCQGNEVSFVNPDSGQSVFTEALLQGLNCQLRGVDRDGKIYLESVAAPVMAKVQDIMTVFARKHPDQKGVNGGSPYMSVNLTDPYGGDGSRMNVLLGLAKVAP